eukprot:TRINITY_DN13531_c0_g1_i3.p1 TRINITY_DN13531_c0_g1~~TRINITY_DN13531_c0_g1_i3.p1  ORF type:complete len:224 (+),score=25.90 TRINITY_DN13531_c0_g1_i3:38-709(+)
MLRVLLLVSLIIVICSASNGLDMSNDVCNSLTQSDWNCLVKQHNFTIIEGIRGGYGITKAISTCVSQARAAQFKYVDLYIWMCPNCEGNNPPSNLINQLISTVGANNFGMVWLDIEACDNDPSCWSTPQVNLDFIRSMANAIKSAGKPVGIYSTPWEWRTLGLTGLGVTEFKNLPLWYANPDGTENFNDFSSFGGWTVPAIKQYSWTGAYCGVSYDADWYPDT